MANGKENHLQESVVQVVCVWGDISGWKNEGLAAMRGADELSNVGSQIVGDIDSVETYGSTCLVRAACSDEFLALGGGEEADRAVDSNGRFVVHVRDDGHGEICQREHRATHDGTVGVQVVFSDGHFADSVIRCGFDDAALRLSCEFILSEVRADLF